MPSQSSSTSGKKSQTGQDPRKSLGKRIKELRLEHGITQEELSERSGLFRTYMSRIESGLANPTLTILHKIAGAFQIDVRELFTPAQKGEAVRVHSVQQMSRGRAGS